MKSFVKVLMFQTQKPNKLLLLKPAGKLLLAATCLAGYFVLATIVDLFAFGELLCNSGYCLSKQLKRITSEFKKHKFNLTKQERIRSGRTISCSLFVTLTSVK